MYKNLVVKKCLGNDRLDKILTKFAVKLPSSKYQVRENGEVSDREF